jgi:hypothetical protein
MNHRYRWLMLIALAGCAPKFLSGSTECSSKSECPSGYFCSSNGTATKLCFQSCSASSKCESGFVCANDGINTVDVCMDKGKTTCQEGDTYYCKSAGLCWADPIVCSTISNCGTTVSPDYRACSAANLRPDCNGKCVAATGVGGSGGSSGVGGSAGSGGRTADAGVGGVPGTGGGKTGGSGGTADAGVRDAGLSCSTSTTCSSGQQCLGGRCCIAPAAGGECNQLPSCGCSSGKVCYPSSTTHAMACIAGNNLTEGADCTAGLSCQAGLGCFGGVCKRYCNNNSDCPLVAGLQSCLQATWSDDSSNILGVKVCGRLCDPAHPQNPTAPLLACPPGFGCQAASTGLSFCFQSSPLPAGATCSTAEDCSPGYYCSVAGSCNKYCLVSGDCPTGQTCQSFSATSMAGSFQVGYCGP